MRIKNDILNLLRWHQSCVESTRLGTLCKTYRCTYTIQNVWTFTASSPFTQKIVFYSSIQLLHIWWIKLMLKKLWKESENESTLIEWAFMWFFDITSMKWKYHHINITYGGLNRWKNPDHFYGLNFEWIVALCLFRCFDSNCYHQYKHCRYNCVAYQ